MARVGWLTAVWVGLWGDLSWANLAGGALVATITVVVFPPLRHIGVHLRPLHFVRLVAHFAYNLVTASAEVAWAVIRPHPRIREAIIAVPITATTPGVTLVIAAAISLTPGTLVIDTIDHEDHTMLYIHVFNLRDRGRTASDVAQLERLVVRALSPNHSTSNTEHGVSR